MLEKDSEWILPENLREQEDRERRAVENGNFDGGGDFGSYYAYYRGINYDFIRLHVIADDQKAFEYASHIDTVLKRHDLGLKGHIIDIGCAIGSLSNAIARLNPHGKTYGLDISRYSIEVAKNRYPNVLFFCQSADSLDNFDDAAFDVIHAREFYPFTRTNDADYHLKYLKLFHSKLKAHGCVLLQMVDLEKGFCNTYEMMSRDIGEMGYAAIEKISLVPNRMVHLFGDLSYAAGIYPILRLASKMLFRIIGRRSFQYLYILTKK